MEKTRMVEIVPGMVRYDPGWIPRVEADEMLRELLHSIDWQQHYVRLFGKDVACPRLSAWQGDPGSVYTYSGHRHDPGPWSRVARHLRDRLRETLDRPFSSVLLNLYRDGRDSMGLHSDDEPELGRQPVIASVSLGAERNFVLKPVEENGELEKQNLTLEHGSLLIMQQDCQQVFRHALPRTQKKVGPRINLTFRTILETGSG